MEGLTRTQEPPFSVQLEPVEGCNLRCGFCGIRGIRERGTLGQQSGPFEYMGVDTAAAVGRQCAEAGWNPRLELAMHGEPTLHPELAELVRVLHHYLPRSPILVLTNGLPWAEAGTFEAEVTRLFAAGCSTVAVDDYRPHRARDAWIDTEVRGVVKHRYPEGGPDGNPHRRTGTKRLVLVHDLADAADGTHSTIGNHAGAGAPPRPEPMDARCARPFREVAVRWDGNVAICCNDWRGTFKVGNVHQVPLPELWQHPALEAARRMLYAGRRDFAPCTGCDHTTTRNGLLPDKKGKATMPEPEPGDAALLAGVTDGPTYTPVVLRRWER